MNSESAGLLVSKRGNFIMKNDAKIILETERLILRTWTPEDIDKQAAMNIDPRVMEYFPSTQDHQTAVNFVEYSNNLFNKYGFCLYAAELKETGELIGFIGLNIPNFEIPNFKAIQKPVVEIGWRLGFDHWGKGYATEGAKAVLQHGFSDLNLKEIISFTAVKNMRSRNVMEKLGLTHNEADDYDCTKIPTDSHVKRQVLYRLTQKNYSKQN